MAEWEAYLNFGLILIGVFLIIRHVREVLLTTPLPTYKPVTQEGSGENTVSEESKPAA